MSNTIIVRGTTGNIITTLTASSIMLTFNGSPGVPSYYHNGTQVPVGLIEAELDSGDLTIDTTVASLPVNYIRVRSSSDTEMTSLIWWGLSETTSAFCIVFSVPEVERQWVQWEIGDQGPPIRLKVKLTRNV